MLTALIVIATVLIFIGGIAYFFGDGFAQLHTLWTAATDTISSIFSFFPGWILAFLVAAVAVAVISLVVKLI